jgi:hypothetical protein
MWTPLSAFSDLSTALILILAMVSHFLDYFVAANELTARGNIIAGSITDIVRSFADLTKYLPILLGNFVI